jgi:hypothetical protein
MKKAFEFGRLFLFQPSRAAEACENERAIDSGLKIYAVWVVASLAYLWLKPYDFPDVNAPVPAHAEGFGFWLRVALWEPVLAVMNVALTALVLEWMREGWLPVRTAVATLWSAVPLLLTVGYTKYDLPRAAFGALLIVWAVPGVLVARRVPTGEWRKVAAFLLGLNAVGLVLLIPEIAATALRSDLLYKASLFASVAWLLVCGGVGLSRLCRISAARAVLAFLFANLVLNLVIAAAYLLHWLPLEVLKVLVYV